MLTHSIPSDCSPSCARSYISRSSWPTIEVGALIMRLYIAVRAVSCSGAVDQPVDVAFHQGLVGSQWDEHPQLLDRPLDHDVGEIDRVVPVLAQDRLGLLLAIGLDHLASK